MELLDLELRMQKTIEVFEGNLSEIRAGRANPAILNKISVEYYGVPTPINQVAGISVPEARMIVIQPWDASILKEIEKAILASDIGLNPNNDGKVIRLNFPELTADRRKELAKDIRKMAEEAKVSIRSIRRDGMDEVKDEQKDIEGDPKIKAKMRAVFFFFSLVLTVSFFNSFLRIIYLIKSPMVSNLSLLGRIGLIPYTF